MKWFLSERFAVRGLFNAGWQSLDGGKSQSYLIGIAPGFEYHWVKTKSVHAYLGAAAAFGLSHSKTKSGPLGPTTVEITSTSGVYGLSGLLGVEYFAFENVSFGAEYQLVASSTSSKTDYGSSSTESPRNIAVGLGTVAVVLAVYW